MSLELAANARFERRLSTPHRFGRAEGDHSPEQELNALAAELLVAEAIGFCWEDSPLPDSEGDCGYGVQVRWTPLSYGRLPIRPPDDKREHAFFLVTGKLPVQTLRGWVFGWEAMDEAHWGLLDPERPKCWRVQQSELHSVGEFVALELRFPLMLD